MAPPELIKEVDQLATLNEPLSLPLTSKPSPLSLFALFTPFFYPKDSQVILGGSERFSLSYYLDSSLFSLRLSTLETKKLLMRS